ncbi:hypothetical protein RND81_14G063000 [Saponaria officinalis]|uniref:Dihydrolipoamide acetyltransferase component of pyruvate dehydrogenase complex n=1 Tax=Saponaria officinalis TaxID=3572 RepID=A0AAW1GJ60_SAPOF
MFVARQLWRKKPSTYAFQFIHSYVSCSPATLKSSPMCSDLPRFRLGFDFPTHAFKFNYHLSLHFFSSVCGFTTHAVAEHAVNGLVDVPLAQTGEGIAECELMKWFVQEGDLVEEFQPLCEVQSDKATIEITSRYKGMISQILHTPGDIVKVGETLLKMAVEEFPPSILSADAFENESDKPNDHGDFCSQSQSLLIKGDKVDGVLCTPAVRNLAKELGVNVSDIKGSGKDGRLLKEDVVKYVGSKDADHLSSCSDHSNQSVFENLIYEDKVVPLRGFQRVMVKSMTMAASIPHFHYVEELKCDALIELKSSFKSQNSDPSIKHTFLPFLVKSLSMALSKYPLVNSSFNEDMHEIIVKGPHNIGIAMATPYGLVVPNVKKVQSLTILEITKEISRLQQLAVENKLSQGDITGGTITISNIGAIGGKFGSPLINLPEVAIIAIGRIQKVPHIRDDGTVYPVSIMNVNIGADHRVLDGATVAKFCNEWKSLIEKPELLLLHMR